MNTSVVTQRFSSMYFNEGGYNASFYGSMDVTL